MQFGISGLADRVWQNLLGRTKTVKRLKKQISSLKKELSTEKKQSSKNLDAAIKTLKKQGDYLVAQGQYERAEAVLRVIGKLAPQDTRHFLVFGNVLMLLDKFEEAEKVFRKRLARDPSDSQTMTRLADALSGLNKHLEAVAVLEQFMELTGREPRLERRVQTHLNLANKPLPEIVAKRDEATKLLADAAQPSEAQQEIIDELRRSGIAITSCAALFGSDTSLWDAAKQEFDRFVQNNEVVSLAKRISGSRDFAEDPEFSKVFKPSAVSYRDFFGEITIDCPIAKLYSSPEILGIANAYNEMASKIRNMTVWLNPPLHPDNVNGRTGSQLWHRDQEDSRILKCFIYFDDIDEGSGATDFIKNTSVTCSNLTDLVIPYPSTSGYPKEELIRAKLPEEDFISADGKAGTLVFLDTNGFHRGGYARENARHIALCTFLRPVSSLAETSRRVLASEEQLRDFDAVSRFAIT
jgi:tetratricopeptide (TPR) repeat protein